MHANAMHVLVCVGLALCCGQTVAAGDQPQKAPAPRTDRYGDLLPDGATARFGSLRLRHVGLSDYVIQPGDKTVLSAGSDRVLRFWDLDTGRQARTVRLQGTAGPGRCVTLSPDGKTLVALDKGQLVFWDVESGKELKTIPGPKANVGFMYFSPDGKTLAVGRTDWIVSLWDWQTGKEREIKLPFHRERVLHGGDSTFHGSFSPDGKWFVSGVSSQGPLGVFEASTGREIHRLACFASVSAVSPDSRFLAVSSSQNDKGDRQSVIRLFDLTSGRDVAQFPFAAGESFYALAFSPDGNTIACTFSDKSRLLDLTTGKVLHKLSDRPLAALFSGDGKTLLASSGRRLRVWNVATGKERDEHSGEVGEVLAVSPDGRLLASADWMKQAVSLWDTASGRLLGQLPLKGEGRYVRNLAFTADGKELVASQGMGFLQFWDTATGLELRTVQLLDVDNPANGSGYFYELHVSSDGKRVSALDRIFGPNGSATRLAQWDVATGKLAKQQMYPAELRNGAWLADGKARFLPLKDGLALAYVASGDIRYRVPQTVGVSLLAASPDGRLLAGRKMSRDDKNDRGATVVVWETATGKKIVSVATGRVERLALAPDNRCLITTDDEFLRVWDLATGKERRRWSLPHKGIDSWGDTFVQRLLLSPDGGQAFTVLGDGTALSWDLAPALRPAEPLVQQAGDKEIASWWSALAAGDAGWAYTAVWRLAEAPEDAVVGFLRKHLKPVVDADFKEVRELIAALDSDQFEVRAKAIKKLENLGNAAAPALRQALDKNPSLESRRRLELLLARPANLVASPEILRRLRAMQVLERIGSRDACQVLAECAKGVPYAEETQEAKASLERLSRRASK